jgi:hypothetical protein
MAHVPRCSRGYEVPSRTSWRALAAVLVLGLVIGVACAPAGPDDPFDDADFTPTREPEPGAPPSEVDLPDTRGVVLQPVPGAAAAVAPVKVYGGEATLYGRVSGPDAGTGGARVRIERFVGVRSDSVEVAVDDDGTYRAERLIGGRYRVRAFRAPDLAMISSSVFFLPAEEDVRLDLGVTRFGGADVQAELLAGTLEVGESANVVALAQEVAVDGDGIVRGVPMVGASITADGGPDWQVEGAVRAVGADGTASWTITCRNPTVAGIIVEVGSVSVTVNARCRAAAPSTTAPPATDPPPTTTVEVGDRFTPPIAGPIAPGRYSVVESSGTCAFVYQPYVDDRWSDQLLTASGADEVALATFGRDLEPLGGGTPCTYERVS